MKTLQADTNQALNLPTNQCHIAVEQLPQCCGFWDATVMVWGL